MQSDVPTPITDEFAGRMDIYSTHEECFDLARRLERRNAELAAMLQRVLDVEPDQVWKYQRAYKAARALLENRDGS